MVLPKDMNMPETIKPIEPAQAAVRRAPTQWKIVSFNDELTIVFPDQENAGAKDPTDRQTQNGRTES